MSKTNLGFNDFSGRIGQWSFTKSSSGRTFVRHRPTSTSAPTDAQLEVRRQFRLAAAYARAVAEYPVLRAPYEFVAVARKLPLKRVIMTDYLRAPVIDDIVLTGLKGLVGNPIKIVALDDMAVMSVSVELRAGDGTLLEQGAAVQAGPEWVYTTTVAHPSGTPVTITATAVDRPGNRGVKAVAWS